MILIFRLPTVCKLLSFLNTGRDSGGGGGGGKTARSESGLCRYEYVSYVLGTLGFIFIERCKNMKFKDFLWNSQFLINSLTSYVLVY
jgi:hypothetical protein